MLRWLMLLILVAAVATSGYYRYHARRTGAVIARRSEGGFFLALRMVVALSFLGLVLGHAFLPQRMAWATIVLSPWARWAGVILGVVSVFNVRWVLRSLGRSVSETVLTREHQKLVTHGPYRWVRHPLYTTGLLLMLALSLIGASWALLLLGLISLLFIRLLVIPLEEQALIARFGDSYRNYMTTTGCLLPRI